MTSSSLNLETIWSVGFKKSIKLLKSYGYLDKELDLTDFMDGESKITTLHPFGDKLVDDMVNEEDDVTVEEETEISDLNGNLRKFVSETKLI